MSELVLTLFVYLSMIMLTATLISVGIVLVQLVEDTPLVRKKIWGLKSNGFLKA